MWLFLALLAHAEDMYATADTTGVRWLDSATVTVSLTSGDKVEVLARDGDKIRVRKDQDFGWVAAAMLTDQAPVPELPEAADGEAGEAGEMPGFAVTPVPAENPPAGNPPAENSPAGTPPAGK